MAKPAYRSAPYRGMQAYLRAHPDTPCHWCLHPVGDHGVPDHLIPVALGGGDDDLIPACSRCNNQRGGRLGKRLQMARRAARRELCPPASRAW